MLQLKNHTKFKTKSYILPNENSIDTLYILAKASFVMSKGVILCDEQKSITEADEYHGEPSDSSLKFASEIHTGKGGTDIVMLGSAYSKDHQLVNHLDVNLKAGSLEKSIRVFGDRFWHNGIISCPTPFRSMPLIYEKAYGGKDAFDLSEDPFRFDKNPIGLGFFTNDNAALINEIQLPNLEDPNHLISHYLDQPDPVNFSFCSPNWQPRMSFAGTYDEDWQNNKAPYLPEDFNNRFNQTAHNDLIYPSYLQGGETVEISNMHPLGTINYTLPTIQVHANVSINNQNLNPKFHIESLVLDPNSLQLSITWRAALECNNKVLKINNIDIYST